MKPQIKFDHKYLKLTAVGKEARLLQVLKIPYSQLSSFFIEFDTKYFDNNQYHYFEIEKSKEILLLIFKNHVNKLFTTVRRYTPEKYKWYKSNEGNIFEVIINSNIIPRTKVRGF